MNQLKVFPHSQFGELPAIAVNGTEWFGATEAAKALSFSDPYTAIRNHVDDEDLLVQPVLTEGGTQNKKLVNESGLYSLIFGAAKQGNNSEIREKAKQFKRWITHEVIPAIRKTGSYSVPTLTPNEAIALSLKQTAEMMTKVPELESKIEQVERKVDKQITLHSGEQTRVKKAVLTRVCEFEDDKTARKPLFRLLYKELYERYEVPSYKDILRKDLQEVLQFVSVWRPKRSDLDRVAN